MILEGITITLTNLIIYITQSLYLQSPCIPGIVSSGTKLSWNAKVLPKPVFNLENNNVHWEKSQVNGHEMISLKILNSPSDKFKLYCGIEIGQIPEFCYTPNKEQLDMTYSGD